MKTKTLVASIALLSLTANLTAHAAPQKATSATKPTPSKTYSTSGTRTTTKTMHGTMHTLIDDGDFTQPKERYYFQQEGTEAWREITSAKELTVESGTQVSMVADDTPGQPLALRSYTPSEQQSKRATSVPTRYCMTRGRPCPTTTKLLILPLQWNAYLTNRFELVDNPTPFTKAFQAYFAEMSYGKMDLQVKVAPENILLLGDHIEQAGYKTACDYVQNVMSDTGIQNFFAQHPEYNPSDFDHIMLMYPRNTYTGCASTIPVTRTINGQSHSFGLGAISHYRRAIQYSTSRKPWFGPDSEKAAFALTHEFGHMLGLHHSPTVDCGTTSWLGECKVYGYGEPSTPMGGGLNIDYGSGMHFKPTEKRQLGWATNDDVINITSSGTYTLSDYQTRHSGHHLAARIYFPNHNEATYWIAYQTGHGYSTINSGNEPEKRIGLAMWRDQKFSDNFAANLSLDLTPGQSTSATETYDIYNATTSTGQYHDPDLGLTISAITPNEADKSISFHVSLEEPDPVCRQRPPFIGGSITVNRSNGDHFTKTLSATNRNSPSCGLGQMQFEVIGADTMGMENITLNANPVTAPSEAGHPTPIEISGSIDPSVPNGTYYADVRVGSDLNDPSTVVTHAIRFKIQ